ncbi:MAG: phosphatase PAP2 family protein [Bacteroidota bacterium]
MLDQLIIWDHYFFDLVNGLWKNNLLDTIFPFWRHKLVWIPVYVFIFSFLLINFKKQGMWIIFFALLTITFSDMASSKVIKPLVNRDRPCHTSQRTSETNVLIRCGPGKSFPSSHATNHFGLALFLIFVLGKRFRWITLPLLFWAGSIAYGQVYVGVHYPFDAIGGAVLGGLIGGTLGSICERRIYFIAQSWT